MLTASNKQHQRGFTLIELVVVIVIIGILAAFAIPRFAGIASDARISSAKALAGTLRSTSALVHGLALAQNQNGATGSVTLEGTAVALVFGYPAGSALGIGAALINLDPAAYTVAYGATTSYTVVGASGATPANCAIAYVAPTAANTPAQVNIPLDAVLRSDC